jgi:hypothetical protein
MEPSHSTPIDWLGASVNGFVTQATFSPDNQARIAAWLEGLKHVTPGGIHYMAGDGLHITLLDWVAPLIDYGEDKQALYDRLYPKYDPVLTRLTVATPAFDVHFNEVRITPTTVILVGQDDGQFASLRARFTEAEPLPEKGKQPPVLIHSSLLRFIAPAIDLSPVRDYIESNPLDLVQHIDSFRLVHLIKEPMMKYEIIKTYPLAS